MPNKSAINLIEAEIAALNALLKTLDESFDAAVDHIVDCSGKIIVIGIGKSDVTDNDDNRRYLTISKNKLTGFHGNIVCNLDTSLSRYTA